MLKTQQNHCESASDRGLFTWQSLTLPGLLNKLFLAQLSFFSKTKLPFDTDLTAAQRTACTGIQTSQCVKGRGVSDPDPGITGASALWPSFSSKLYSLCLISGFLPLFCGATYTNWEWQQMLLVVISRSMRVGRFTFLLKLCGNLDLAKQLYDGILLHLKPFWHKIHSKHFMLKHLRLHGPLQITLIW